MNINPLRRTPIQRKPRTAKQSAPWREPKIRLDATGMAKLRSEAFKRSNGICECGRPECEARPERLRRVTWNDSQLHHKTSRARGGSDSLTNVQLLTRQCHSEIHGKLHWSTHDGRRI